MSIGNWLRGFKIIVMKYGWLNGDGVTMQYVELGRMGFSWGITTDFNEATSFKSIEECQKHWLEIHAFPDMYRKRLNDGYLKYFEDNGQMIIV